MDEMEDNTTVLSTLRSFNKFLSQPFEGSPPGASTSNTTGASLQMQFQQKFQNEDRAEQIFSKTRLIQVEREKNQMELSYKRARIELEKEASESARNYEREADKNHELMTRIKALEEKEMDFQSKLQEQSEMNKSYRKTIESQSKKLVEKEDKLSEANEAIMVLKGKVSEQQLKVMNLEMQLKTQELEKQELDKLLEFHRKKLQDSGENAKVMQELQALNSEYELKIKTLEQKLSSQEQDAVIVKCMKSDLEKLPKVERELQQLREENSYYREMRENNALLKEEVESLRRAAERHERMKEQLVALELDNEKIQKKLKNWENTEQRTGLSIKTPDDLSTEILAILQREFKLKEENLTLTNSSWRLESARQQLQDELQKMQNNYLEEKKKRELHDSLVRRLQQRVLLLSKERDGLKAVLQSYESELSPSGRTPQISRRLREAEENLQRVHGHIAEMEVKLSQALEESGLQKQRAEQLTAELTLLKSQMSTMEQGASISSKAVTSLRLHIEELEAERGRLEKENKILERLSVQTQHP
ncbi:mitotic spindle assembly checkpoint protein MAD1 isoform 2-T2 [Leptodactylus fuscus]